MPGTPSIGFNEYITVFKKNQKVMAKTSPTIYKPLTLNQGNCSFLLPIERLARYRL